MSGSVVVTVVCAPHRMLVDVGTRINMAEEDSMPGLKDEWPPSEPCRLDLCQYRHILNRVGRARRISLSRGSMEK